MSGIALVIGAGKIARGFVGHLLYLSGWRTTFVDTDPALVARLRERESYQVHVLGRPDLSVRVGGVTAVAPDDLAGSPAATQAALIFVSVGGQNLGAAGATIASALAARAAQGLTAPVNIVTCENWNGAGRTLRTAIEDELTRLQVVGAPEFGVAEATIMRSCVDPTPDQRLEDPASVQVQNFWLLELDKDALVAPFPDIEGMKPQGNFGNALRRKLFMYNMLNATISYTGWLLGHQYLADAANDPRLDPVMTAAAAEVGSAMGAAFGYSEDDQREYAARALAKFRDPAIVDPLSRQVKDPIRKLSHGDRLVGSALFCYENGVVPSNVALGIAAALRHRNPDDAAAVRLAELVAAKGPTGALAEIGELPADHPVLGLVDEQSLRLDALLEGTTNGRIR